MYSNFVLTLNFNYASGGPNAQFPSCKIIKLKSLKKNERVSVSDSDNDRIVPNSEELGFC